MRKKVLVLFMTLSLVLSFMPVIAFADTEAEGSAAVSETVEAEQAEPIQDNVEAEATVDAAEPVEEATTEEEAAEEDSQQTVHAQALYAADDEEDPEACKHENTYLDEDVDWDNPKYEEVEGDNRYHKLIYPRYEVEVCDDCEEEISRKAIDPLVEEDNHNYVDGVCVDCGHKNTCTHDEMDTYTDWEDEDVKYTPKDNKDHHVTGTGEEVTVCMLCGYEESRKPVQIDEDEEHEYERNEQGEQVCVYCGHKNTCTHKNTRTEDERDWEKAEYIEIKGDDLCHKVTGPVEVFTYCNDCGVFVKSETVVKDGEYDHNYNSELVCEDCGHKNGCKHEHTEESYDWDSDEVKYTPVNNKVHRVKGPGELQTWCEDCHAMIKSEKVNIDKDFYHDYDSNHKCTECGHSNTCKHPSTYFEYDYDTDECKITDNKDGKTHTVEGNIEKITWCKECEEQLKTEELGKTKVSEIHYYNRDNVCRYCGYHQPAPADNTRIYGKARYDTALAVAERYKGSAGKFDNVIVAYGRNFPDALSGGYLAKVKNAPILLVEPSEEGRIVDYISKNIASGGKVYILGGTGVVSAAFESKVKAKGVSTERLGGATRYETNLEILKAAGVKAEDILVCTGAGYADSLSASSVGKPILLVGDKLTAGQEAYIKGLSSKQYYLIGGTGAVKPAVESGLKALGLTTERLWGKTRYETSTAVAKKFFEKAKTVVLAYAQNFPDGLSGGPLAMLKEAPIVLTDSKTTAAAKAYVKSAGIVDSITLGGPALISDIAVKTIMGR